MVALVVKKCTFQYSTGGDQLLDIPLPSTPRSFTAFVRFWLRSCDTGQKLTAAVCLSLCIDITFPLRPGRVVDRLHMELLRENLLFYLLSQWAVIAWLPYLTFADTVCPHLRLLSSSCTKHCPGTSLTFQVTPRCRMPRVPHRTGGSCLLSTRPKLSFLGVYVSPRATSRVVLLPVSLELFSVAFFFLSCHQVISTRQHQCY